MKNWDLDQIDEIISEEEEYSLLQYKFILEYKSKIVAFLKKINNIRQQNNFKNLELLRCNFGYCVCEVVIRNKHNHQDILIEFRRENISFFIFGLDVDNPIDNPTDEQIIQFFRWLEESD